LDIQRLLYLTIRGVGTIYVREPPTMTFLSILGAGHRCTGHADADNPLPNTDDDRIVVLNGA